MTGPDHYREAENLVAKSQTVDMSDGYADLVVQQAQVHAALALAAATAEAGRLTVPPRLTDEPVRHMTWRRAVMP